MTTIYRAAKARQKQTETPRKVASEKIPEGTSVLIKKKKNKQKSSGCNRVFNRVVGLY
jgi:hypothetical protein